MNTVSSSHLGPERKDERLTRVGKDRSRASGPELPDIEGSDVTNQTADTATAPVSTWRYPKNFWIANGVELFERAAYYGTFIALALFLTDVVGFTDVEAGWIGALFASMIYLLPF